METATLYSPFNATQLHLLKMFAHIKSEENLQELKSVLVDFYQKKLDKETDKWWEENNMTDEKFEKLFDNAHYRHCA